MTYCTDIFADRAKSEAKRKKRRRVFVALYGDVSFDVWPIAPCHQMDTRRLKVRGLFLVSVPPRLLSVILNSALFFY